MDRARNEQIATLRPQCLPGSIGADRVGKEKVGRCSGVPSRDAMPVPDTQGLCRNSCEAHISPRDSKVMPLCADLVRNAAV